MLPLVVGLAVAAFTPVKPQFSRSSDVLGSKKVTARQVANVLGRWKTRTDWNDAGIGRKALIDEYRTGDYYEDDLQKLETDFTSTDRKEHYIARRPQFLDFCERYGLVARWVHRENVASLPFADDEEGRALAASVGATVEELNAEPVDELAADVVFDALSFTGLVGFVEEDICDARRASFFTPEGGFDAGSFASSLSRSRRNLVGVVTFGPGLGGCLLAAGLYRFLPQILEGLAQIQARVDGNIARYGPGELLVPIGMLAAFVALVARDDAPARTRQLSWQERATQERDEVYRERSNAHRPARPARATRRARHPPRAPAPHACRRPRARCGAPCARAVRRKKRGELDEEEERLTPFLTDEVIESYYAKQYSGQSGMRVPFLDPDFYADKLRGRPYRHRKRRRTQEEEE